jgi:hypothetical protein
MNLSLRFVVSLLAAVFFGIALVQTGLADAAEKGPCADDVAKYCKGVKPGHGNIMHCLKENNDKLSVACKEKMSTPPPKDARKGTGACREDIAKFCKGVKPGEGRIVQCMKARENELSAPCRDEMKKAKDMKTAQ